MGSITSDSWLVYQVLFTVCLLFQLLCMSNRMVCYSASIGFSISISTTTCASVHVSTVMAENPIFLLITRLFITHGKDMYLQSLNNPSKSRLALCFENPIFTTFCTTTFVHCCRVAGNTLIRRTRSFCN